MSAISYETTVSTFDGSLQPNTTVNPFDMTLTRREYIGSILYYVFLFIAGGLGNVLSLLVALKIISNRRKTADLLIVYLTVTDLLCVVSTHSLSLVSTLNNRWIGSRVTCTLQYYFAWSCLKMSFFILILMTLDRYVALVKPIYYRTEWGRTKITVCVLACFVFSFGGTLLTPILQWDGIFPLQGWFVCLDSWTSQDPYDDAILLFYGVSYLLSLLFFNFCSIRIAWELIKLTKRRKKTSAIHMVLASTKLKLKENGIHKHEGPSGKAKLDPRVAKECRIAYVVLIMAVIFVISWSPYLASIVLKQTNVYYSQTAETWAIRIVFANTALNPLLYGLLNKTYRRGYCYFLRVAIHYLSCRTVSKPEDNNIFYLRRSWLQRRQRELYISKSMKSPASFPSEIKPSYTTNNCALALSSIFMQNMDAQYHVSNVVEGSTELTHDVSVTDQESGQQQ